jgi:hypothetical protein
MRAVAKTVAMITRTDIGNRPGLSTLASEHAQLAKNELVLVPSAAHCIAYSHFLRAKNGAKTVARLTGSPH